MFSMGENDPTRRRPLWEQEDVCSMWKVISNGQVSAVIFFFPASVICSCLAMYCQNCKGCEVPLDVLLTDRPKQDGNCMKETKHNNHVVSIWNQGCQRFILLVLLKQWISLMSSSNWLKQFGEDLLVHYIGCGRHNRPTVMVFIFSTRDVHPQLSGGEETVACKSELSVAMCGGNVILNKEHTTKTSHTLPRSRGRCDV